MGGADSKHRATTRATRYPSRLADRPSPPGKPQLVPSDPHAPEPDVVTIRWEPPLQDGGSRITGYLVEHRRTGSPHWVRSAPALVKVPELTLSGLEPGWRYQFRVSAQNTAGLSEPGELSDLLTVTLQRTAASAPHFVKELRNTVALENEKAELSVQVRGTPTPNIAWFKDGTEIFSSRSYRIVTDNEASTLIIHQAALSDEGEIKCSATNRVGYAVTRAKLTLEAPPSIRLPRQYEEGLLFEKDEVIRLKVSVAGRPVPEVTWLLNGEPVPGGGRYEASHSERYATLRVGEARREDRGEYQVRATNRLGEDVASFLVTVADRPVPPGRAKVVMTLGRSVTLSWTTPEDDGGCKIGNYIVEYYRLGWNMWLKAATCRQLTTTLGDLIEGSEYKFRVKVYDGNIVCAQLGWNMWLKAATCRQLTTTLGDLIEGSEYKFRVKVYDGNIVCSQLGWNMWLKAATCRQLTTTLGDLIEGSEYKFRVKVYDGNIVCAQLGWNMWLKAATCRQLTTTLGDLIEGSEYKFRVKAENPYGVSDPSSESDVVFIPDPKRGLLEPPEHGPKENESAMDVWLEDKKRPISPGPTIDEQYGERKTKRKRGPMAPPQLSPDNLLGQADKNMKMNEESMSPPVTLENYQPQIPKRRGKAEKFYTQKETTKDNEPTRNDKEQRRMDELKRFDDIRKAEQARRIEELKMSEELRKPEEPNKPEDSRRDSEKPKSELKVKKETPTAQKAAQKESQTTMKEVTKPQKDPHLPYKDTQLPQKDPQKSQTPRVEHDPLHGSSELMLVLLPHSRATTEERETSKRELFESSMAIEGDDIAPPMSLSAPELGSGDPPELPLMRSAFSSTELLHDRAMARFYQDMAREEAESSVQRKSSLQRRRSFERRSPLKSKDIPDTAGSLQDIASSTIKEFDEKINPTTLPSTVATKPTVPELPESSRSSIAYSDKKTFSRDSMDSMLSVEDPHRKSMLVQQASEEDMEYEDSSFDEDEEDFDEEEDEEPITDEVMDEEIEEELEEEEEEEEEEFSNDEKRGSYYTSESEEESRYSYSMEEDTYYPSAINKKYNEDTMISAYEGRGPLILGSGTFVSQPVPVTVPQVPSSSGEIKLKPILKRPTVDKVAFKKDEPLGNDQSLTVDDQIPKPRSSPEKRFEPNFSPAMPKPILKVRDNSQEPHSPVVQRRGAPTPEIDSEFNVEYNTNLDEGSDYETGATKKHVRIEEPEETSAREYLEKNKEPVSDENNSTKSQVPTDTSSRERTGSLIDEGDATMVVVSHYSDIVAEFGRGRRPPRKLYLNYEALKAAAEEEEESLPEVPEIVVDEPEHEPEPEPSVPTTTVQEQPIETESKGNSEIHAEDPRHMTLEPISEYPKNKSPSSVKKRSPSPRKPKPSIVPSNVIEDIPPEKTEYIRTPSPELLPRKYTQTEKKVHSYIDFLMDISLFILACWLYIFKDERLSIPVLCLMIYRQAHEAFQRKMEAIRNKIPTRVLFWRRQQ